jgi:hypothetical protein
MFWWRGRRIAASKTVLVFGSADAGQRTLSRQRASYFKEGLNCQPITKSKTPIW